MRDSYAIRRQITKQSMRELRKKTNSNQFNGEGKRLLVTTTNQKPATLEENNRRKKN